MIELVLTAVLSAEPVPFVALTLDGQATVGGLITLNSRDVVLETGTGTRTLALASLSALGPKQPPPAAAAGFDVLVELIDGTSFGVVEYSVADGIASVRSGAEAPLKIPTKWIRSVRFGNPANYDPKLTKQWSEIGETKAAGDLLVVRAKDALDYLEGVLGAVDADVCHFDVDGETIKVKRPKIEGLVYARNKPVELQETVGKVTFSDGARLPLAGVEVVNDSVTVTTPIGWKVMRPIGDVSRFDFSSGKIAYLSDLEPDVVEFTPLVGFNSPPPGLLQYYAYRRDVGFAKNPLRLDGKVYQKGLALASRTKLAYKLPGKFRLFRATVGIDDSVRETGSVNVEIKGDGKSLWHEDVRGTEPAKPVELDISGIKRLEVVVDYGDGLDVGDRLDLAEAQVTK